MEVFALVSAFASADVARRFPRSSDFDALDAKCDEVVEFQAVTRPAALRLRQLASRFDVFQLFSHLVVLGQLLALMHALRQFLDKQKRKTNVVRLATARYILQDIEALHGYIDLLALELGKEDADEALLSPSDWRSDFKEGRSVVLDRLDVLAGDAVYLIGGLSHDNIFAGLVLLKREIELEDHTDSPRELKVVKKASATIIRRSKVNVPRLPAGFVSLEAVADRHEIVVYNCNSRSIAARERHPSDAGGPDDTWNRQTQVVLRNIEADPGSFEQKEFLGATETWLQLAHANVVRLRGGCHFESSTTSPFVVYEDAITASFVTYFLDEGDSSHRKRFWRLFLQIARGVQYLHNKGIQHGDLKCSNLVVSVDGTAKVCDFVERASTRGYGRHVRQHTIRWKAPECVISNGPDPSFEADVFALGLCLIEAWVGELPYCMQSDDDIESLFQAGHTHERPDGLPDSVWSAVERLCAFDPANRPSINEVVALFSELADQEQQHEEEEAEAARAAAAPTDSTDSALAT